MIPTTNEETIIRFANDHRHHCDSDVRMQINGNTLRLQCETCHTMLDVDARNDHELGELALALVLNYITPDAGANVN